MTNTEFIQILDIIASFLVSIVAIVISIAALRQNSKMIEASTRPNLQIYPLYINSIVYIIIKNFGASKAYIDEIKCTHKFTKEETFGDDLGADPFDRVKGAIFCPGYSIKCPLIGYAVSHEDFNFFIKYHAGKRSYSDTFIFNLTANASFADLHPSSSTNEQTLKNIANELHDIVKLNL